MTEDLNRDRWLAELRSRVPEVPATEALARPVAVMQ